jgi:uncharacterized damage-inducible protein DinB
MEDLRYPIGKYIVQPFSDQQWKEWLIDIQFLPQHIENAILNLDEAQLNTPYRDGGWTVKQVVHHVADSHMNAYIRFKLGLTEDTPAIKPYDEVAWAEMVDTRNLPINISLTLIHSLHTRWYEILRHMTREELDRKIFHPERKTEMTLWDLLGLYAWHSRHHTAHITSLRERMKW